jgi:hypothetical protein
MPEVEEREQVGDSWPEALFEEAQEEPAHHHAGPVFCARLDRGYQTPSKDDECCPPVWREDFPTESEEGEDDVGDVELCEFACLSATARWQVLGWHACLRLR